MNLIKKLLTISFLSLHFLFSNAQTEKVSVKFSPLALIDDVSMPTIQGGLEVKLSKRIYWYNEVGVKYRRCVNEFTDTDFVQSRGFKLKSEIRYYLKGLNTGFYVAGNAFFINDYHNTRVNYFALKDSSNIKQDAFGVHKKIFGINVLAGFQQPIYKNFLIDLYLGLGVRFRMVNTVDKVFNKDTDSLEQTVDFSVLSIRDYVDASGGNSVVPNFTGGIRLCYRF